MDLYLSGKHCKNNVRLCLVGLELANSALSMQGVGSHCKANIRLYQKGLNLTKSGISMQRSGKGISN
jgi:hypothetical protein